MMRKKEKVITMTVTLILVVILLSLIHIFASLEAEDAAVLDAVPEAAPPQPVSTPAHRARAVTAAASFLVSIFLIVLSFPAG